MKYFTCITCMLWCLTVASPYVVPKKGGGFNGRQSHDRGWAHAVYENEIPDTPKEELNCHDYFELRTDSIVRTKDSLKAGAKFISAPNVNTADECLEQCLCDPGVESDYCDMAVFEQNNKNCYLFNCVVNKVNKCLFAHHEGYFSMVYDSGSFTKAEQAGKHAGDLTDVREGNDENVHEGKQPIPKEPTEPGIVHLPTTISTTTTTTTTKVQKCSRYEFQCDNGDCIGIYYACDTIAHCLDRSDEKGCDYDYSNTWYYYTMGNGGNYDDNYKYDYKSYNDYEKTKEGYEKSFSTVKTTNQESEDPLDHDQDDEETVQSWEPTTPTAVKAQTDKTSDKAKENYPITKAVSGASVKQPTEAVQKEIQNMSVEVDAELISRRTTPETSVILPLAIGLAITLVLLVMVACRLRMVKRKLRHGRPLANSQEADYLINGMYL